MKSYLSSYDRAKTKKSVIFAFTWLISGHIAMHVFPLIENDEVAIATLGNIL